MYNLTSEQTDYVLHAGDWVVRDEDGRYSPQRFRETFEVTS